MQEFMLFIKTDGDHMEHLSQEQQQAHVQKVGAYIGKLMGENKLKGAQPLEMGGRIVSNKGGNITDGPFTETKEVLVGYFHLIVENEAEAVEIAKANPMLEDFEANFEIRPIKSVQGIN